MAEVSKTGLRLRPWGPGGRGEACRPPPRPAPPALATKQFNTDYISFVICSYRVRKNVYFRAYFAKSRFLASPALLQRSSRVYRLEGFAHRVEVRRDVAPRSPANPALLLHALLYKNACSECHAPGSIRR